MQPSDVSIVLLYEPTSGRPVPIARASDPALIVAVAKSAISDASARASRLYRANPIVGKVERAEVKRLKEVLALLVPDASVRDDGRS
jgi:hypothetical protein